MTACESVKGSNGNCSIKSWNCNLHSYTIIGDARITSCKAPNKQQHIMFAISVFIQNLGHQRVFFFVDALKNQKEVIRQIVYCKRS